MNDFVFVILHFNTYNDTYECVNSILNQKEYDNYKICIVDNGSENDSYYKLNEKFKSNKKIILLHSDENLGFAKGNNIGYKYAKMYLNPKFIIMINSDTIMKDNLFLEKIDNNYKKYKFGVCGPDIYNPNKDKHQNPKRVNFNNVKEIKRMLNIFKIHMFLCYTYLEYASRIIEKLRNKLKRKVRKLSYKERYKNNIELHGACLIFSKEYIDKFDGINESTFLYFEESFLYFTCKFYKIDMYYFPEMFIIHNEQGATKSELKSFIKRKKFYYKNSINYLNELIKFVISKKGDEQL